MKKLKSAEELYSQLLDECPWSVAISKSVIKPYILELVKIAQIDAIKNIVENCSNDAKLLIQSNWGRYENFDENPNFKEADKLCKNNFGQGDCTYQIVTVSKQSILNVADKMIEEL
jgi:hypothetical protein